MKADVHGMPKASPRIGKTKNPFTGSELPRFVYPNDVVDIRTREQLDEALKTYSHPTPSFGGGEMHGLYRKPHALRYLVEWVYPALRWFCKAYGMAIPSWLQKNHWADGITKDDQARFFGKEKLRVVEWARNDVVLKRFQDRSQKNASPAE